MALAFLVGAGCGPKRTQEALRASLPEPIVTTTVQVDLTSQTSVTLLSTTTIATPGSTTTTEPTTTTVPSGGDRINLALGDGSKAGHSLADGDWDTARVISPQYPEWSNQKFEQGFAGLESATDKSPAR